MSIENKKMKSKGKPFGFTMICFFIIISLFYLLIIGIKPETTESFSPSEIEQIDLSKDYVLLSPNIADWYPGALYEPKDFSSFRADLVDGKTETEIDPETKYGTYRMVLNIPANKTYGITGLTADYAQKVYVDGELLSEVGKVSHNDTQFTPKTDYYSLYFVPQRDTTEIVIQVAYFNHEYGYLNDIYLGEQEVIIERNREEFLSNGLILGVLLAFSVFFLGMFLTYTKRISFLWFALACLCAALRYAIYFSKDIMVLLPDLSWYVLHKVEYMAHMGFYFFLVLHVVSVLNLKMETWAKYVYFGGLGGVGIWYTIMPSTIYTQNVFVIGIIITILLIGISVYILLKGHENRVFFHKENLIVGISPILMTGAWLVEAATYQGFSLYVQPYVTMIIVFFNAIALTMQFSRTQRELILSQIREREIAENAAMLEQINNMKTDFFHKMAHEIKTPLAIMSGYAQLTSNQIARDEVTTETTLNLKVISAEAKRLAELVSNLMEMPTTAISQAVLSKMSVSEYLHYASVVCRGLLDKKGNSLVIKGNTDQYIIGNVEMLVQMMINLTVNSNAHMEKGQFTIEVIEEKEGNNIILQISDTGSGIPKENEEIIFEKGFTTSGTKGLGLPICKEIVELHKGDIVLLSDKKEGTTFKITIPIYKDEEK